MTIRTISPTTRKRKEYLHLVSRGWDALVEKLGYADATRFVMLLDKGSGDSVKYFRDLWKDTSAEEIYRKMIARRQQVDSK
ncbi:MAG: hypothetical protein HY782_20480 [Chloroflexi bacterium]|nr:hypothetical protein [Chloroflexota bacterium]